LYDAIFCEHTVRHPDEGLPASVRSITLDDVKNFYRTHYTAGNVVIGIGGDFDTALVSRLTSALSTLPPGAPAAVAKPSPKMPDGIEAVLVEKETKSTAISIGFPISLVRGEKDFYALWIANSWLGEHRILQAISTTDSREKGNELRRLLVCRVLPQCVGSSISFSELATGVSSSLRFWIRPVQTRRAHFALRAAIRELQGLIDRGMSPEDFALTRGFLRSTFATLRRRLICDSVTRSTMRFTVFQIICRRRRICSSS